MTPNDDIMTFFWKRFSKTDASGRQALVFKDLAEVELLYRAGFIDASAHSLEEWKEAFAPHLQKDGSLSLTEKEWMEKGTFLARSKEIVPFDPLTLREGAWDVSEFERLIEEKILPSTLIDPEEFRRLMKPLQEKALANGRVVLNRVFKTALKSALDQFPSPLRLMQFQLAASQGPQAPSGFAKGRSETQAAVDQLSRLLGRNT